MTGLLAVYEEVIEAFLLNLIEVVCDWNWSCVLHLTVTCFLVDDWKQNLTWQSAEDMRPSRAPACSAVSRAAARTFWSNENKEAKEGRRRCSQSLLLAWNTATDAIVDWILRIIASDLSKFTRLKVNAWKRYKKSTSNSSWGYFILRRVCNWVVKWFSSSNLSNQKANVSLSFTTRFLFSYLALRILLIRSELLKRRFNRFCVRPSIIQPLSPFTVTACESFILSFIHFSQESRVYLVPLA